MSIGIIGAMESEVRALQAAMSDKKYTEYAGMRFCEGLLHSVNVVCVQCGIGKVNAAVGTATLIRRYAPDCIISTGCAGGIDESLEVMDVVVSTETTYHDVSIPGEEPGQVQGFPARFLAEQELVEVAQKTCHKVRPGLICSGDQFISNRHQLNAIKAQFPDALAVDMESAAIAHTCFLLQTPFVSFRILSDTPGADEHLQQYFNFWDEMASRSFEITRHFLAALPEQFAILRFEE